MESLRERPAAPTPLVPAALALAAGVVAGRYVPLPVGAYAALLAAALATTFLCPAMDGPEPLRKLSLAAAVMLLGAGLAATTFHRLPADHIAAFCRAGSSQLATVTGRVLTPPRLDGESGGGPFSAYRPDPRTRFVLETETVTTAAGPVACRGRADVAVEGFAWDLAPGDRVRIAGRLGLPAAPTNPGGRDWRRLARDRGVLVRLTCPAGEAVETLPGRADRLSRGLWRLRALAGQRLQAGGDGDSAALLRAMILGRRAGAVGSLQTSMVRSGVAHLLSISGLHLGILLGFVYVLMRLGKIAARPAAAFVLVLLGAYLLVVEPRTPVLRGAIMAATFCTAVLLGRSASAANLLALAAIILLAADPADLFRPGFQLSFGIVAGILLFTRPVRGLLFGRWLNLRDLLVFDETERLRRWWWRSGLPWLANLVSVSIAAYLAAAPLTAYHFGVITPLAPLATLALLPLTAALLVAGYGQLLLSWWTPNLASSLSTLLEPLTDALIGLIRLLGEAPACVELKPVPAWGAWLLAAIVTGTVLHRRLGVTRAWALVGATAGTVVFVLATQAPASAPRRARLTILDVRNGSCAALRTRSGAVWLFDAGSRSLPDAGASTLLPLLDRRRWPAPTAAFISHAEIDHYNALPALIDRRGAPAVFVNPAFAASPRDAQPRGRMLRLLDAAGAPIRPLHRGRKVVLDEDASVTVLWPPPPDAGYESLSTNDGSLVLRLDCGGSRVLLPGDVEELGQRLLLDLPHDDLAADVLVLPHHGSYTPALAEFIQAVDPDIVVRSAGRRRSGAARRIRALAVHRRFYATNTCGAVDIEFRAEGPAVETHLER